MSSGVSDTGDVGFSDRQEELEELEELPPPAGIEEEQIINLISVKTIRDIQSTE